MDPNEPTHFNVLVAGTGLQESILAAALSKAGYSVLQLDDAPYYGTEHASLSLTELADWASRTPGADASAASLPPDLARISNRFALSLYPVLLRAKGPGLDLLVRSKVASYLQFGLLAGVGLWQPEGDTGKVIRVPASKADVFNDATLSLVEKRRLTKLLLFAAGQDPLEEDKVLVADPNITFVDYLKKGFSLSGTAADSLAYALALCSSPNDPVIPALQRLRTMIHAIGRYGPSPYLVGHYGGAGDLVGGFSRICAVWGGGQILGRPLLPLDLAPEVGQPVPPSQAPFMTHDNPPPPPAAPPVSSSDNPDGASTRPLGIPVVLEEGQPATVFTGDWVVSSPHLFPSLFPSHPPTADRTPDAPRTAHLIAVLREPIPFPPPPQRADVDAEADDEPDSKLFVFPPGAVESVGQGVEVGTCTALQVGKGTMSCPEGYHVLYLTAPLLSPVPSETTVPARAILQPYLDALLALSPSVAEAPPAAPVYSAAYFSPPPPSGAATPAPATAASPLPANFLLTPSSTSPTHSSTAAARIPAARTSLLVETLDLVPAAVEDVFWQIVGEQGREEGVKFFAREEVEGEDEDGEE